MIWASQNHTKGVDALRAPAHLQDDVGTFWAGSVFVQNIFVFPEMFIALKSWKTPNHKHLEKLQ